MRRPLLRIVVVWLLTAAAIALLSKLLEGFRVETGAEALLAAALIGLVNAFVWPALIRLALPFTVLTLGLGVLVLNGAVVLFVSEVEPGVHVRDLAAGIAVAVGITLVNTLTTSLLAIDDDDFYYRNVLKRQARRAGPVEADVPGVYFLEIDGLAHTVIQRAIRDGNAPTLARLAHDSHRLIRWETDWSSQTGACQAGLLHGSNDDMPAFRWWEKDRDAAIVTNHPRDAAELERARRTQDAERELRELLRRTPDSPTVLMALATLLARHNRTEEARSLAQRVLDGSPAPPLEQAARRLLERLDRDGPRPSGARSAQPQGSTGDR